MVGLSALWLPIVVSAVIVFVVSSLVHMVLPWHKKDFARVPDEDRVMELLRGVGLTPGDYMLPRPDSMDHMKSAAFREKCERGPKLTMTVMPNGFGGMGSALVQWFIYLLIVAIFAAYVAGRALGPGAAYLAVFRFAGVTAFAAYALALWQLRIWWKRSWHLTIWATIDGLVYALLTAGTFGWLWPR
ncbi:MAG TPA: hypothetical protein VFK16_02500 [Gemmatimonadaceae bacterium]|nr:hypothetical protein [Gemmatimonadaceae bacterium]